MDIYTRNSGKKGVDYVETFDKDFFADEWREGHFVEEKMKRIWAAQIEVLAEVDRICQRNGIQYFADSGTLLGAVRHKGFIPWDDDTDIAMKRRDYQRFVEIASKELPKEWRLDHPLLRKSWKYSFSRVLNGSKIRFDKEYMERFHGCPYVVGVDIFPIDNLPESEEEREVIFPILKAILSTIYAIRHGKKEAAEDAMLSIEETCRVKLDREGDVRLQLWQLFEKMSTLYQEWEVKELVQIIWWMDLNRPYFFKKEWYEKSILMPFENIMIPVPGDYDQVLRVMYGDDYMTPKKDCSCHTEAFYVRQDEIIKEMRGK